MEVEPIANTRIMIFVGCHRTKFTTSISVHFSSTWSMYNICLSDDSMQGKLTRPTEAGAKADAEATKSNDTAADNFMVN